MASSYNLVLSADSELKLAQDVSAAIGAFNGTEPYAVKNIPDGEVSNRMLGMLVLSAAQAKAPISLSVNADGTLTISGSFPEAEAPKAEAPKAQVKGRKGTAKAAEAEVTTYSVDPAALKVLLDAGMSAADAVAALKG